MLKLYLLRHAKSSWMQANLADFDRPLNPRGKSDAPNMARRLQQRGANPDRILSSPAARAAATARAVANVLELKPDQVVFDQRLYLAGPDDLIALIKEQEVGELMLVGHNPGFTQLACLLSGVHIDNMPTCSYAEIIFDGSSWADLRQGMGQLLTFDWPKAKEPIRPRPDKP